MSNIFFISEKKKTQPKMQPEITFYANMRVIKAKLLPKIIYLYTKNKTKKYTLKHLKTYTFFASLKI